ncbi:MAG: type II toxin-antitoxin system RelE/ParE family toxin [Gammaproteobacteria bacterium]|nr:type II toxin-antitoxin system RelE/ParE family toxin [Gammaproteobacteria bacterium]
MARYEPYALSFRSGVAKDLRGIPRADVARIMARIEGLREEPRPPGCERLSAQERYRVRQGRYRILYTIDDPERVVEVVKVGHRREVYRESD